MNHIPTIPPPAITPAQSVAESEIIRSNQMLADRVNAHRERFTNFWDNPQGITPDAVLAGMGTCALWWLRRAGASVDHIQALAEIGGQALDEVLPPEFYRPRRAFQPAADGAVTLAPPADGYDLHGRLIPVPADEPETP